MLDSIYQMALKLIKNRMTALKHEDFVIFYEIL